MRQGPALAHDFDPISTHSQLAVTRLEHAVGATRIEDLRSTSRTLEDRIKVVSADTHRLLELTHDVVDENRPEIAESMRRLRRTMWEAEMAMRKIRANPAYLIFGDDEQILNQNPYDTSWIRRSGRAEPFEQRDENVRNVDKP